MKKIELLKPIKVVVQTNYPIENLIDDYLDAGANRQAFKDYLLNEFNLSYTNTVEICQSEMICDYIEIDSKTKEVWLCNKQKLIATPYQEERINFNWMEIEDLNVFIYSNDFILTEVITNNPKQKAIVKTHRIKSWEIEHKKDLMDEQFDKVLNPNKNTEIKINLNQFKSLR